MSTFAAGQKLRASYLEIPTQSAFDQTSRTTTSTTFTSVLTPAGLCGLVFTAPPSGKVTIDHSVELKNSSTFYSICAPSVRAGSTIGSGTIIFPSQFDYGVRNDQSALLRNSSSHLLTGLTPGSVYNVSLEQVVGGGTGTFVRREVIVRPELA